jgi:putative colanic acid biosynthesis UDP-glucose lipid carrier transferase
MAMMLSVGGFVVAVLCAALARQLADEFKEWIPWITDKFVKLAVAKLPAAQRERFGEEWRSHLNQVPGCIAKLVVATGLPFAARQIASTDRTLLVESMARRALDLYFSAAMLVFCAPLIALLGLIVRLESGGPMLYQRRVLGQGGAHFGLLSFRIVDMNRRPTRFGLLLQKFGLHDLPALLNLLKGDLALVGPRPHIPLEAEHLARLNPKYWERMKVKPGLFAAEPGLAAFCPQPDELPQSELDYDLEYVKTHSLLIDLTIIWRTMLRVCKKSRLC